jgi:AraC-like DNA-binding protein
VIIFGLPGLRPREAEDPHCRDTATRDDRDTHLRLTKVEGGNVDAQATPTHRHASELAFNPAAACATSGPRPGRQQAGAPGPAQLTRNSEPTTAGTPTRSWERKVHNPYFFAGREGELRVLIDNITNHNIGLAACAGGDPDAYHLEEGRPSELSLVRCIRCPARLACLALALRAEDPEAREGWYGGLGPADREGVAAMLRLETLDPPPDRAIEAARLRTSGWTINDIAKQLGCSRRTVQRYLRMAA